MGLILCRSSVQSLPILLLLFYFLYPKFVTAIDTITITKPINHSGTIISGNKAFELGFFSPVNSTNRYVGIWFSKIPVRTVVWVANRDRPVTDSSGNLMISDDGNLIILNGQNEIIWSSNVSTFVANSSARLLDNGNLILLDDSTGEVIWESFQHPSDSFLQDMELSSNARMGEKTVMKSWTSPSNPFVGSFHGEVNPFSIPEFYVWNGSHPYWRSGPWNGQVFIGVQYMSTGYRHGLNVVVGNEGTVSMDFTYNDQSLLFFYVLNHNGSLMEKIWTEGQEEPEATSAFPSTECEVYGTCGEFGSCNSKDSPICSCLPGFEPKRVEEWNSGNFTSGCMRRTPLQCERNDSGNGQESKKSDGFLQLKTMKVPEYPEWASNAEDECENLCLKNCSCTAYTYYTGIGCMLWRRSLIDIQKFSSNGADLYIRVAYSELDKKRNMNVVIAISVILGSTIIIICAYFSWKLMVKQREDYMKLSQVKLQELPLFKFEKLAMATNRFNVSNKLGHGGFGPVYKGTLPDGQEIAVKRLSRSSDQGLEEFMNEVIVISKLQHRNLVRLLGLCVEREEKMLVYEYMPNKSLDAFLFDPHKQELLSWSKRLNIIEGVGRGLLYLHRDSRLRIIHRDLKASNILLDVELNPKISDFGMARIFGGNEDQGKTRRVVGTYGYMSPEYAMQGRFSEKSDVFSFGVLILEVISGRRNTSFHDDEQFLSLLEYAWKLWNEDKTVTLIDPTISHQSYLPDILRCIQIGLLCVQELVVDRPTMSAVIFMLSSKITNLTEPKQPAFTQRPHSLEIHSRNDCTITIVEG